MNRKNDRKNQQLWLLVLCFFCIYLGTVKGTATITFTKVDYDSDQQYAKLTCNIRKENDVTVADIHCDLLKDLGDNFYVENTVLVKNDDVYEDMFSGGRINVCTFLNDPKQQPFLKYFFSNIQKYGNVDFSCPIKAKSIKLDGFKLDPMALPSFTPAGDYRIDTIFTRKDDTKYLPVYSIKWYVTYQKD